MKIKLTKRELLAVAFHVQPKPLQAMEQVRARRAAWAAFGATEMAHDVAELARTTRVNVDMSWLDRKTEIEGELETLVADWLLSVVKPPYEGPDADFLFDVHEKLVAAKK